jgi:hypothetical protein
LTGEVPEKKKEEQTKETPTRDIAPHRMQTSCSQAEDFKPNLLVQFHFFYISVLATSSLTILIREQKKKKQFKPT